MIAGVVGRDGVELVSALALNCGEVERPLVACEDEARIDEG